MARSGIGVAHLARRQLLQRRGQHAHLHELRRERCDRHRGHLRPDAARSGALQDRLDDRGWRDSRLRTWRPPAAARDTALPGGDDAVDVAHQVAEGVGPRLLVAARQVRVRRAAVDRAATDPSAAPRSPARGGRTTARSAAPAASRRDAFDPHTSITRSFLWPAHTWPTENDALARRSRSAPAPTRDPRRVMATTSTRRRRRRPEMLRASRAASCASGSPS